MNGAPHASLLQAAILLRTGLQLTDASFEDLDAPLPRFVVVPVMVTARHRHKVFKVVIVLDAIEVMDEVTFRNRTVGSFPYKDVFRSVTSPDGWIGVSDMNVAILALTPPTLPRRILFKWATAEMR